MMAPITLAFRGQTYTIPAARAFEAGEAIERIVTLGEVGSWGNRVPFFTLARCYAAMLTLAGAEVTKEDVFAEIMAGLEATGKGAAPDLPALTAVHALVNCLMGSAPAAEPGAGDGAKTPAS